MRGLDDLDDEQVALLMEAAQVGIQHGLDIAEARIKGDFEVQPLSWERVKTRIELANMPPGALDDAVTWGRR